MLLPLLLASCAGPHAGNSAPGKTPRTQRPFGQGPVVPDDHVPPFASVPWQPFSREAAVAIAQREWRLFGGPIDDDPPDTRPPPPPELKPEREPGLWQRVGEYWWIGQDPGERESSWTGKHDENGVIFDAAQDGSFAWSAAFISYVMRIAGAGADFPYSPNHATYINAAAAGTSPLLRAYPPGFYPPEQGDLICLGRGRSSVLSYANLPTADLFPAHCDMVVGVAPSELTVIGGNVDDAVTMKHVPLGPGGKLTGADGRIVDTRYPWMVVLKVLYADASPAPGAPAMQPAPVAPVGVQPDAPAGATPGAAGAGGTLPPAGGPVQAPSGGAAVQPAPVAPGQTFNGPAVPMPQVHDGLQGPPAPAVPAAPSAAGTGSVPPQTPASGGAAVPQGATLPPQAVPPAGAPASAYPPASAAASGPSSASVPQSPLTSTPGAAPQPSVPPTGGTPQTAPVQ